MKQVRQQASWEKPPHYRICVTGQAPTESFLRGFAREVPMFDVVLFQPEIPPNTGNIMRLCANTGCRLHLIEPLGFSIDSKSLRRAGMDYRDSMVCKVSPSLDSCIETLALSAEAGFYAFTTHARQNYTRVRYQPGDALLFGAESAGLPGDIHRHRRLTERLRVPMCAGSRSLNLSNAVAVVVFEAWRQQQFSGGY